MYSLAYHLLIFKKVRKTPSTGSFRYVTLHLEEVSEEGLMRGEAVG